MRRRIAARLLFAGIALALGAAAAAAVLAVSTERPKKPPQETKRPRAAAKARPAKHGRGAAAGLRRIAFTTDEGTWMSLDVSPDGRRIVFDLLGDIYVVPIEGGAARRLTGRPKGVPEEEDADEAEPFPKGQAWDDEPRFSPDGRTIAFISDRSGGDNLWVMDADGKSPRPVTEETVVAMASPAWTPDGKYVIVSKTEAGPKEDLRSLWMYHTGGGSGVQLTSAPDDPEAGEPAVTPDGRYLLFSGPKEAAKVIGWPLPQGVKERQVMRLDLDTGDLLQLTGTAGGAFRPTVSPDGRFLAYGSRLDAKTVIRLRDLDTGAERVVAPEATRDDQEGGGRLGFLPAFDFTPDGASIVYASGGRIHRVDLAAGRVRGGPLRDSVIPFRADIDLEAAPRVDVTSRVDDGDLRARAIRWPSLAPDGRRLVCTAFGKIYVLDLPDGLATKGARARRLTRGKDLELFPGLSPDGRFVVYASWSDREGGALWKVGLDGGEPVRLTRVPRHFASPRFSPDGTKIVAVVGSGAEWRGEQPYHETWHRLAWVPAQGGEPVFITTAAPFRSPHQAPVWSGDGTRVFYLDKAPKEDEGEDDDELTNPDRQALYSIRLDGTDRRIVAILHDVETALPSPDSSWLAFTESYNVYLTPLPKTAGVPLEIDLEDPAVTLSPLTTEGGGFLEWTADGRALTWAIADRFFRRGVDGGGTDSLALDIRTPRSKPHGTVVLRGARLVTMERDAVIERGDIVVTGNRIAALGESGRVAAPPGATVVDVAGRTITPGFVDLHDHPDHDYETLQQQKWHYVANLAYGMTTSRDPSARSPDVFSEAELVAAGDAIGPRIYSTGDTLLGTGEYPRVPIESLEDARHHVRRIKSWGAIYLKEYLQPRREQRQWLAQAAREEGIDITAEGGGDFKRDLTMALDGYTGFEHSLPYVPIHRDVVELLARSGVWYTPTLVVAYGGPGALEYFYQHLDLHDDAKVRRFLPHNWIDRVARRRPMMPDDEYRFIGAAEGAARVAAAGGHVGLGAHGNHPGLGVHFELWALVMGGMTPREALRVATLRGAEALGLASDLGSLARGKLADLLVFRDDPREDIRKSASIEYVMKDGVLFRADTMDEVWPEARPCPPLWPLAAE